MFGCNFSVLFISTVWIYFLLKAKRNFVETGFLLFVIWYDIILKRRETMGKIKTYIGNWFDPMEPDLESIDIRDIAHALSLTCRGNGHVKQFFSVGQHCVNCALEAEARGYSKRVILGCLLHDAGEAYMSDVPRPFKQVLKEYQIAEDKLIDLIYTKYLGSPLSQEEKQLVSRIDDDELYYDMIELLNVPQKGPAPELRIQLDYSVQPFEHVEQAYIEIFERYMNM